MVWVWGCQELCSPTARWIGLHTDLPVSMLEILTNPETAVLQAGSYQRLTLESDGD